MGNVDEQSEPCKVELYGFTIANPTPAQVRAATTAKKGWSEPIRIRVDAHRTVVCRNARMVIAALTAQRAIASRKKPAKAGPSTARTSRRRVARVARKGAAKTSAGDGPPPPSDDPSRASTSEVRP